MSPPTIRAIFVFAVSFASYSIGHHFGRLDTQQTRTEAQMQRTQELLERTQERLDQSAALIVARCAAEGGVDCSVRVEGEL